MRILVALLFFLLAQSSVWSQTYTLDAGEVQATVDEWGELDNLSYQGNSWLRWTWTALGFDNTVLSGQSHGANNCVLLPNKDYPSTLSKASQEFRCVTSFSYSGGENFRARSLFRSYSRDRFGDKAKQIDMIVEIKNQTLDEVFEDLYFNIRGYLYLYFGDDDLDYFDVVDNIYWGYLRSSKSFYIGNFKTDKFLMVTMFYMTPVGVALTEDWESTDWNTVSYSTLPAEQIKYHDDEDIWFDAFPYFYMNTKLDRLEPGYRYYIGYSFMISDSFEALVARSESVSSGGQPGATSQSPTDVGVSALYSGYPPVVNQRVTQGGGCVLPSVLPERRHRLNLVMLAEAHQAYPTELLAPMFEAPVFHNPDN